MATKIKTIPCIQCGTCCIFGICSLGEEDEETGLCKYLKFHNAGHTSCKLYGKFKDQSNVFRYGCFLRVMPEVYEEVVKLAELKIDRKIKGIGGTTNGDHGQIRSSFQAL